MTPVLIAPAEAKRFPSDLPVIPARAQRWLLAHGFSSVVVIGNLDILNGHAVALYCSQKCPGDLVLKGYDLAVSLRERGVTVISGFQSPMERDCLALLLHGSQPVVVCPARSIEGMRIPSVWSEPLTAGRLLIVSPFDSRIRRPTSRLSELRNQFAAALSQEMLIIYAEPGGRTDALARQALVEQKSVLTLESPSNAHLLVRGARVVEAANARRRGSL